MSLERETDNTPNIEIPVQITLTALNAIQKSNINKQKMINAATIQEGSTAQIVAENLHQEILNYQSNLPDSEDVAISIVQFGQSTTILVDSIGYIGYNLVRFGGKDNSGKPLELIQHISQLNFLLTVVQKPEPEVPKRPIGFVSQND